MQKQIDTYKKEARGNSEIVEALEALAKKLEVAAEADNDAEIGLFGLALPNGEFESLDKLSAALTRKHKDSFGFPIVPFQCLALPSISSTSLKF